MRISDWSSDVCSSDLTIAGARRLRANPAEVEGQWESVTGGLVYREDEFPDDLDAVQSLRGNEGWLVWTANRGHGTVDLHIRTRKPLGARSEEHTSELQTLMRISYADICLQKKN